MSPFQILASSDINKALLSLHLAAPRVSQCVCAQVCVCTVHLGKYEVENRADQIMDGGEERNLRVV